jgi:hypothetical protein
MEHINPKLNPMPKPTYTISLVNANGSSEFPRPDCLPQAGGLRFMAGHLKLRDNESIQS